VRFTLDPSFERHGQVVIAGSPLRLFRVTDAGRAVVERIVAGDDVEPSRLIDRLIEAGAVHPRPAGGRYSSADVTVVMPVHGRLGVVPAGAVVVDDASQPPVATATIRREQRGGPGAARMSGLEHVSTPLVAFVDADVELPANWLDPLVAHFDDDAVGLVAPRVRSANAPGVLARYERRRSPLDLGAVPARIRSGTRVSYVPAAAVVCRVDAVRAVGGFDPTLRFGEDVDLVWRLDETGWRCRYEPTVEVVHAPRSTWRAWIIQRVTYGASAAPLSRRHPGALAPVRMSGWSGATWLLAALGRPAAAVAVGAGTAAALVPKLPDVPPAVALRLAGRGNLYAGRVLADAVRRVWWPIVAVASLRSRRARLVAAAALVAAGNPVRALDDVAYGIGVWRGMLRERTLAPIRPACSSWPGRGRGR
jgi:mycofactocin glycosyltransferase